MLAEIAVVREAAGSLVVAGSAAAGMAFIARLVLAQFIRDERRLRQARAS